MFRNFRSALFASFWSVPAVWAMLLCGGVMPCALEAQSNPAYADAIPRSREADDLARYVAGLPGRPGSPFIALEPDPAWIDHRQAMNAAWANAERDRLAGLRDFQQKELTSGSLREAPVFYPFGGPDALTATLYFPHSPEYVLVGLEPSGTAPAFASIQKKDQRVFLGSLRSAMASEIGHSFFITREMDRQFRGQVTDGLLVPVLHELVRTGHTILGFRYIRLNESGKVIPREANYHAPGKIGNKGFEVEYQEDANRSVHRLSYFTVNLSDEYLRQDSQFLSYMAGRRGVVTLFKATSYMPHHRNFSRIRAAVLENSSAILQDDSGIPFHFFGEGGWSVKLYGEYTRPYGSFRWLEQPDLRKAYVAGAKPLSVRVGYGYARVPSNLLLAERVHLARK
ncbi:MAG: hypothetical protein ABL967_10175 [Bryobacteraceae bacterium]